MTYLSFFAGTAISISTVNIDRLQYSMYSIFDRQNTDGTDK